jgi:hypothetical protein
MQLVEFFVLRNPSRWDKLVELLALREFPPPHQFREENNHRLLALNPRAAVMLSVDEHPH